MTPIATAEIFAEWLRRRGHRVARTASSYWVEIGPRIWQAFPYHWVIEPGEAELAHLLRDARAVGLRYSTPLTAAEGAVSYHVVYEGGSYSLNDLPKKARYDVRQGLSVACVEPIPFERLAHEGWTLRVETLARQGRAGAESRAWWEQLCLSATDLPGFEAWGAIAAGRLVASLLAFTLDGWCAILYQQSLTEYLKHGVNNALAFALTQEVIGRAAALRIFYGLHSLDAPPSVDAFKFRMGYTAKPVRQRVAFHPWLAPLFGRTTYRFISSLSRRWSGNAGLAKAEGLIRFYLDGRRPLAQQTWPPGLHRVDAETT